MIAIRKCIMCGETFDADIGSHDQICESCSMKGGQKTQVNPYGDVDSFSAGDLKQRNAHLKQSDKNGYYRQRWSGSLAKIDRDGEQDPGLNFDDLIDQILQQAESQPQQGQAKKEEESAIQAAFSHHPVNKFGVPKKENKNPAPPNGTPTRITEENPGSAMQNDALTRFLDSLKKNK